MNKKSEFETSQVEAATRRLYGLHKPAMSRSEEFQSEVDRLRQLGFLDEHIEDALGISRFRFLSLMEGSSPTLGEMIAVAELKDYDYK